MRRRAARGQVGGKVAYTRRTQPHARCADPFGRGVRTGAACESTKGPSAKKWCAYQSSEREGGAGPHGPCSRERLKAWGKLKRAGGGGGRTARSRQGASGSGRNRRGARTAPRARRQDDGRAARAGLRAFASSGLLFGRGGKGFAVRSERPPHAPPANLAGRSPTPLRPRWRRRCGPWSSRCRRSIPRRRSTRTPRPPHRGRRWAAACRPPRRAASGAGPAPRRRS